MQTFPFNKIQRQVQHALHQVPGIIGNDAVNFFKDSFKRQGWMGATFVPWRPRKTVTKWGKTPRNKGRAILVDRRHLGKSIRITNVSNLCVTIGTDVPYARVHNDGFKGTVIQQVRAHQRRQFLNTKISSLKSKRTKSQRVQTGSITIRQFTRSINQNIPQRKFMGDSPILKKIIERRIVGEVMKAFRK